MRLISCHIDNFGKISNFDYCFNEDINTFCEENGWGKSTLAAFLRIMFYGLNKSRKNGTLPDREKYAPWQGGTFGGHIDFVVHLHEYRLTRIFKNKEANDIFELRDLKTNLISNDFSSNIGEEIFKINAESFVRTVFVSQSDCETAANGNINAKIGNLSDNTGDLDSYEKACEIFKNYLNANSDTRVTGSIAKDKARLSELYTEIIRESGNVDLLYQQEEDLIKLKEDLAFEEEQRDGLIALVGEQSKINEAIANKKVYDDLTVQINACSDEIKRCEEFFAGSVPSVIQAKSFRDECYNLSSSKNLLLNQNFDEKDESRLNYLKEKYKDYSEEKHESITYNANSLSFQRREYESSSNIDFDYDKLDRLKTAFASFDNPVEESEKLWNILNQNNADKDSIYSLEEENNTVALERVALNKFPWAYVISSLMAVSAIILFFTYNKYIGIGLFLCAAVVAVLAFTVFNPKKKIRELEDIMCGLEDSILELEDAISDRLLIVEDDLTRACIPYDKNNISTGISVFSGYVSEYLNLQRSKPLVSAIKVKESLDNQSLKISEYITKFGYDANEKEFIEILKKISDEYGEYKFLNTKCSQYRNIKAEYLNKQEAVAERLEKWNKEPDNNILELSDRICDMARSFENESANLRLLEQKRAAITEAYDFDGINISELKIAEDKILDTSGASERLATINLKISSIQEKISETSQYIQELSDKVDNYEMNKENYGLLKGNINDAQKKYELVKLAQQMLISAKEKVTSEYTDPLLSSFMKYYQIIKAGDERFYMDVNSNITFEEYGLQRDVSLMSLGYRDLIGVCMRIALIDAMYPYESPVIFLDDPFVNLDDEKIKGAKELLKEAAKKYQIIYFTCSKARM